VKNPDFHMFPTIFYIPPSDELTAIKEDFSPEQATRLSPTFFDALMPIRGPKIPVSKPVL
jgi:hypothetical protein